MEASCPRCQQTIELGHNVVRAGFFYRKSDSRSIRRFRCKSCGKYFSSATFDTCYGQKKRRVNHALMKLLRGTTSMRQAAIDLNISRTTVARKMKFLGISSSRWLVHFRKGRRVTEMQFDDMETFEHSKCKPVSITLAVEKHTRLILGFEVSQMPAKGLLAKKARKKYGFRADMRKQGRQKLFAEIKEVIDESALIESDQNPHYKPDVTKYFPKAKYKTFKGRRGCVVGQGELKAGGFDPLFSLNHTCAMLRANINRLLRRTWCTTKKLENLRWHILIYVRSHNLKILNS